MSCQLTPKQHLLGLLHSLGGHGEGGMARHVFTLCPFSQNTTNVGDILAVYSIKNNKQTNFELFLDVS